MRLVVVLPLTPLRDGDRFAVRDWPLHITILQPFDTDATPAEIAQAITAAASANPPALATAFTVVAGHGELFGRRHDVPVTVIAENEALGRLREAVVAAVLPLAGFPEEKAFTATQFRPHITTKHHARVQEGDRFLLTQIAVVDMAPRSSPGGRAVLATVPLLDATDVSSSPME